MRLKHRLTLMTIAAAGVVSPMAMTGCASGGGYYGGYYDNAGVYYQWNAGEDRSYRRWEGENHFGHMDFHRRSAGEQRAYAGWRHH
jgi:hypothetical protein